MSRPNAVSTSFLPRRANYLSTLISGGRPTSFGAAYGVALSTAITSRKAYLRGIDAGAAITASAGAEYSLDGGSWTSDAGVWGTTQQIRVRITSSASYETTVTAIITIGGVAYAFHVTTMAGTGYVDLLPQLAISPDTYDFGNEYIGYTADYTFTLTNSGNEIAEEVEVSVSGTCFSLLSSAGPFNVAKDGGTADIEVRFTPDAESSYTGTITISWPNRDDITVSLAGAGEVSLLPPAAPTGHTTVAGNCQVTIDPGTSIDADSYTYYYRAGADPTKSVYDGTGSATPSQVVTGLTNETEYRFGYTATNENGESDMSTIDTVTPDITYLIKQNVETPTTGWDNSESWTTSGTVSFNTSSPLRGTQDVYLSGSSDAYATSPLFTATDELWVHFLFKPGAFVGSTIFAFISGTYIARIDLAGTGAKYLKGVHGTTTATDSSYQLTAGNAYHIWVRYKKGTGSNGELDVYIGTTTTRPSTPVVQITTGTSTSSCNKIRVLQSYNVNSKFDQILASSEAITQVPS